MLTIHAVCFANTTLFCSVLFINKIKQCNLMLRYITNHVLLQYNTEQLHAIKSNEI